MTIRHRRIAIALAAPLLALPLSACSAEPISEEELVTAVKGSLSGVDADSVTVACEGGELEPEEGATRECSVEDASGNRSGMLLKVTSVEDGKAKFDQTPFLYQADLEKALQDLLSQKGVTVTGTSCPGNLTGKVGEKTTCDLEGSTSSDKAEVEVTEVQGLKIKFNVSPA